MTEGGPPTTYTWRRNGVVITDDDPEYSISIAVTADTEANRQIAGYTSTLVTSLPGDYQYSVTNRAMTAPLSDNLGVQGILLHREGPQKWGGWTTSTLTNVS